MNVVCVRWPWSSVFHGSSIFCWDVAASTVTLQHFLQICALTHALDGSEDDKIGCFKPGKACGVDVLKTARLRDAVIFGEADDGDDEDAGPYAQDELDIALETLTQEAAEAAIVF